MTNNKEEPDLNPDPFAARSNYWQRRRDKIVAEIQANQRGEYTVPTWVLTLALVALVGGIVALMAFT